MAEAEARGKVTGKVNNQSTSVNKAIVWWHDSSAPFVVIIKFSEDCNKFSVRFLKAQFNTTNGTTPVTISCTNGLDNTNDSYQFYMQKMTSGSYNGYYLPVLKDLVTGYTYPFPVSNIDPSFPPSTTSTGGPWNNAFGMGFYLALAKTGDDIEALRNLSANQLWTGRNTTSYGYPFRNNSLYLYDLPNKNSTSGGAGTITSFNEFKTFNSDAYGVKDDDARIAIFGCCEAGLTSNNNTCYSFPTMTEDKKGLFASIMDVELDLVYTPSDIRVEASKASGTTIATQISWLSSSNVSADKLHYRIRKSGTNTYINPNTGLANPDTYFVKTSHTYRADGRSYAEFLCKHLAQGTSYTIEYYVTMTNVATHFTSSSSPIISITTFGLGGSIKQVYFRKVEFYGAYAGEYTGLDNIGAKVLACKVTPGSSSPQTLANNYDVKTMSGLTPNTDYTLKLFIVNVVPYTLTGNDFYDNEIKDTGNTDTSSGGTTESDVYMTFQFKTLRPFDFNIGSESTTGETITVRQTFDLHDSTNLKITFKLYKGSTQAATSLVHEFSLQAPSSTLDNFNYTFRKGAVLNNNNLDIERGQDYNIQVIAEDGGTGAEKNTKTGPGRKCSTYNILVEHTNGFNTFATEYSDPPSPNMYFNSVSTRAVKFCVTITNGKDTASLYNHQSFPASVDAVASGIGLDSAVTSYADAPIETNIKFVTIDHIKDGSEILVTLKAVKYNFNTGEATVLDDTAVTLHMRTKNLTSYLGITNVSVNSCKLWVVVNALDDKLDETEYDYDYVTGTPVTIVPCQNNNHYSHFMYQPGTKYGIDTKTADLDKRHIPITQDGNFFGPYQKNKVFTGLDYFTTYIATVTVTDGFNNNTSSILFNTEFPFARIYQGGQWHKAMPLIYYNGSWKAAAPVVYQSGWKLCDPND